jgi:hypothetical protein
MTALTPRSDVASGGLGGALAVLLMLAFGGQEFDADAIGAAFALVLTFAGGYMPTKYKPLWAAVVAPLATLIKTFIGAVLLRRTRWAARRNHGYSVDRSRPFHVRCSAIQRFPA